MLTATTLAVLSLVVWCGIAAAGLFACVSLACDARTALRQHRRNRAEWMSFERWAEGGDA